MAGSTYVPFSQIDKKLADREDLYIRNMSKHKLSRASSIVVINYPSAEGDRAFNVPRTNIPFNICDHVAPESLRASASFRKLYNNGVLEIVDPDVAEAELRDPAKREALRAALYEADNTTIYNARANEQRANKDAEAAIKAEKQREQSAGMSNMLASMDPRIAAALQQNSIGPDPALINAGNPRFTALETRVKAGAMTGDLVVNELSLMYGDLTLNDLQSIATTHYWPQEAQTWARERIAYQIEAMNQQAAGALPKGNE